ncbi:MAG TPA: amino acid permease, partial [Firmicutes bacterium]|nr:amino acid permease [Bacillota bacterium]
MENQLQKKYGLFTAITMVVGIVIGSGIFFKTEAILEATGGSAMIGILSLLIIGAVMLICSYTFSILATRYEKVN